MMGREVRRVPKDWKHPKGTTLYGSSFSEAIAEWEEGKKKWEEGLCENWAAKEGESKWKPKGSDKIGMSWEEWEGERPDPADYMPEWSEEEKTHLQMYETCTEGSPISPVMETPEALARWLVDNNASAFAGQTASYGAWLRVCKGGHACSAVMSPGMGLVSFVEVLNQMEKS